MYSGILHSASIEIISHIGYVIIDSTKGNYRNSVSVDGFSHIFTLRMATKDAQLES